jgi:hypothetical protein
MWGLGKTFPILEGDNIIPKNLLFSLNARKQEKVKSSMKQDLTFSFLHLINLNGSVAVFLAVDYFLCIFPVQG